jgi:uncharacterized protein (TIGR02996 family)
MTQEDAFLEAITEQPDDDAVRLVFADWLEENGQPRRADFIRVQCVLARTGRECNTPPDRALLSREKFLLEWNRRHWLAPLRELWEKTRRRPTLVERVVNWFSPPASPISWEEEVTFRRGFPESICLEVMEFVTHSDEFFKALPLLRDLRLFLLGPHYLSLLLDCPYLARLSGLHLHDGGWCPEQTAQVACCPGLVRLKELTFACRPFDAHCVQRLVEGPLLRQLDVMSLATYAYIGQSEWLEGTLDDCAVRILADSPRCSNLKRLSVHFSRMGDEAARAIAFSPHFSGLTELHLTQNRIRDVGAEAFAASPYLKNLKRLHLGMNPITEQGKKLLRVRLGDRVYLDT